MQFAVSQLNSPSARECPVCDSLHRRIVHRQIFEDGPLNDGYDVVICESCGAAYADGVFSQADMDRYYSEHSKYSYSHAGGAESPWDFARFKRIVEQIAPHLVSREARIFDIGCATGGLLATFKESGYGNVLGVDPSPACVAAARELYHIPVRIGTLAQLGNFAERFDLILLVGVIEHLREAKAAIKLASCLLNRGGFIYCAVPDVEGLADCPNAPYQQFSTEHVNFFSGSSLKRLMQECGLNEVESWRWTVEWRSGVLEPIASGLYMAGPVRESLAFDEITRTALERYLEFSRLEDLNLIAVIETLKRSQEPILVWGAGTLARRLLATAKFGDMNIVAFIDSSRHFHGKSLAGRPILGSDEVVGRTESILICSVTFADEIAELIRKMNGSPRRIISMAGEMRKED